MVFRFALITAAAVSLSSAAFAGGAYNYNGMYRGDPHNHDNHGGGMSSQEQRGSRGHANKAAYDQMMQSVGGERSANEGPVGEPYGQQQGGYGSTQQYGYGQEYMGYGQQQQQYGGYEQEPVTGARANKAAYDEMMGINQPINSEGTTPMETMQQEMRPRSTSAMEGRSTFQPSGSYRNQNMDNVKVQDNYGRYGY